MLLGDLEPDLITHVHMVAEIVRKNFSITDEAAGSTGLLTYAEVRSIFAQAGDAVAGEVDLAVPLEDQGPERKIDEARFLDIFLHIALRVANDNLLQIRMQHHQALTNPRKGHGPDHHHLAMPTTRSTRRSSTLNLSLPGLSPVAPRADETVDHASLRDILAGAHFEASPADLPTLSPRQDEHDEQAADIRARPRRASLGPSSAMARKSLMGFKEPTHGIHTFKDLLSQPSEPLELAAGKPSSKQSARSEHSPPPL